MAELETQDGLSKWLPISKLKLKKV